MDLKDGESSERVALGEGGVLSAISLATFEESLPMVALGDFGPQVRRCQVVGSLSNQVFEASQPPFYLPEASCLLSLLSLR
jgi:hypothetical protein